MEEINIDKFIKLIRKNQVEEPKIYLNPGQVKYKEYFEKEGYEVVISDTLPSDIDIIYGNFEDKE